MSKSKEAKRADAFKLELKGVTPLTAEQAAEKRAANEARRKQLAERRARKAAAAEPGAVGL